MKILVIIPAYNEENNIANVIREIHYHAPEADIVVIDDGSQDKTAEIAQAAGAEVVSLPFNVGIGGCMQTGYLYAQKNDYDFAVQIDADGQHNAADLPKMIKIARNHDLVIGSRYIKSTSYKSTFLRRVGMIFFSKFVSLLTGQTFTDTTSGYRVANRKVIKLYCQYYPMDYPEVEAIVYLKYKGGNIVEVPVHMRQRLEGCSSITALKSVYYMVKVTFAVLMNVIRFARRETR